MNEYDENIAAILQRLEKIEALLERMDQEDRRDEVWKSTFNVKWEQFKNEHVKMQEHVKENWERLNRLEQEPAQKKAQLWDSVTGKVLALTVTAIATAVLTHLPAIIKLLVKE
jgi:hypothetical protein